MLGNFSRTRRVGSSKKGAGDIGLGKPKPKTLDLLLSLLPSRGPGGS